MATETGSSQSDYVLKNMLNLQGSRQRFDKTRRNKKKSEKTKNKKKNVFFFVGVKETYYYIYRERREKSCYRGAGLCYRPLWQTNLCGQWSVLVTEHNLIAAAKEREWGSGAAEWEIKKTWTEEN